MLVHTYIYNIVLIDNINTNFYTSFRFLLNFEPIDSTTRVIIHAAAFRRRLEVAAAEWRSTKFLREPRTSGGGSVAVNRDGPNRTIFVGLNRLRFFQNIRSIPGNEKWYPLIGIAGNVYWPTEFRNKFPFYFRSPSPSFFINRGIPPNTSISFTIF